jgi:hypothetical protein
MKRLLILLIALSPIFVNAQTFWNAVVDDDGSHNLSQVTDVALFQDSIILITGVLNTPSCSYQNLFAYNTKGDRLWSTRGTHDVIYTDSEYIYTAGNTIIDDVPGFTEVVFSVYNKDGEELYSIIYPDLPSDPNFEFKPKNMEFTSDGTLLVSYANSILKTNPDVFEIQEHHLGIDSQINAIHAITPYSFIIYTQNKIYKSDNSLNLVDSIEFSNSLKKLIIENETVFALFDSHLLRLDTDLQIIDTLISSTEDFLNMEFYGDDLFLQSIQSDRLTLIKLHASENPDTLSFPIFVNNIQSIVTEDGYTFIGNSFSGQIGIYHYQTHDGEPEPVSLPDIELVDFHIEDIVIKYVQILGDSIAEGYHFNAVLTIKNHGIEPINSLAAYSMLEGGMNCARNILYQKHTDQDIPPGETRILTLNRAYQFGVNSNYFCFRCLAPNSNLETVVGNNYLCKTIELTGVEDIAQNRLKVYPNPISDYVIIENPDLDFKTIEIIDINGKVLISKLVSGPMVKLETADLISGLYIVRMGSEERINTQLIVKE